MLLNITHSCLSIFICAPLFYFLLSSYFFYFSFSSTFYFIRTFTLCVTAAAVLLPI